MLLGTLFQLCCGFFVETANGKKSSCGRYCRIPLVILLLCSLSFCGFCDEFQMVSVPLGFEVNAFERDKNWVSGNGVFAFGFLDIDANDADEYVVGIRYNFADKSACLPVWTVGGGLKVPINSTFRLEMDGRLVLLNKPSGITLWSSNTSTLGVQKASLMDNGNLVLFGNKNEVVWESFSSPTNTLLPGQTLHYPQTLRARSTRSISSYYTLAISPFAGLSLVWEHNVTYWRSQFSSSRIIKGASFDSSGVFGLYDDTDTVAWSVSSKDFKDPLVSLRHLRIDRDGNLRIYSWDGVSYSWKVGWQAVQDQCDVFGSCGLYSVCGYNSSGPTCDCLYSVEWGISDGSLVDNGGSGCRKMVDLGNCKMHTSMLAMKQTVLYGLYPPHDVHMFLSEIACKEYCSNDTTCIAATSINDGSGLCSIKRTGFISGYNTPDVRSVSFLKVCSVPQAVATSGANGHRGADSGTSPNGIVSRRGSLKNLIGAIALIAVLTVSVVLSIQILVFWVLYRRRKIMVQARVPFGKDAHMNPHYSVLVRLSFEEIKELTNNFGNQLGTSVFRGELPNKTPIVAKVLENVIASEKEFRVGVFTLSGTHHRNLVSVKGFCFEPGNKILLYEYIPNGSLDKWLFDTKEVDNELIWKQRFDIALGIARGLAYLHSECQKCIPHGNLKLENVLLDENFVPKVTEFGLQNFSKKPEVSSSSESPSERDVYMLGQVFLQIVARKREIRAENLEQMLRQIYEEEEDMGGDSLEGIERLVRISLWCMQDQPFLRPSVGEVVKVLEGTLSVDRPPSSLALRQASVSDTEIEGE